MRASRREPQSGLVGNASLDEHCWLSSVSATRSRHILLPKHRSATPRRLLVAHGYVCWSPRGGYANRCWRRYRLSSYHGRGILSTTWSSRNMAKGSLSGGSCQCYRSSAEGRPYIALPAPRLTRRVVRIVVHADAFAASKLSPHVIRQLQKVD